MRLMAISRLCSAARLAQVLIHTQKPTSQRRWEVDALRGFALVLMIGYHLMFDVHHFRLADIQWDAYEWKLAAKLIKSLFLFTVGVSLHLSVTAAVAHKIPNIGWQIAKRSIKLGLIAMLITLATSAVLPQGTIHFGILHSIALSLPISFFLLGLGYWMLPLGGAIIAMSFWVSHIQTEGMWLLWLGVLPTDYWTVDYAPLIPNLGIILLGVCYGKWRYPLCNHNKQGAAPLLSARLLAAAGKHSLIIYLIHQPVLFAGFYVLSWLGIIQFNTA